MKQFLSILTLCGLLTLTALAAPLTSLTPVKATHPPTHKHKAHKAGKHPHPKHPHRTV